MKKAILEIDTKGVLNIFPQFHLDELFKVIERLEVLEVLKLDFSKGVKIVIADLYFNTNFQEWKIEQIQEKLQDFTRLMKGLKIIVLETSFPKITCLIKTKYPLGMRKIVNGFNLEDLSPALPMSMTNNKFILSIKGDDEAITKALKALSLIIPFNILSLQKASYNDANMLNFLTEQQRVVLLTAKNMGYYTYPRKVNAEAIANQLNLSKNTIIEHLRKAENRLVHYWLAGY